VTNNFIGILLIQRQHFDNVYIGMAAELAFALLVFCDTLPKQWSCWHCEFNIIISFFPPGRLLTVLVHPVSTISLAFRETTALFEMLLEGAAVACPSVRYILTFIHTY
jgi:hypothetical protein